MVTAGIGSVLRCIVLASLLAAHAAFAQSVAVAGVRGMQPGWVRVTVQYDAGFVPSFRLTPTCAAPTDPLSVTSSTALVLSVPRVAYLDLRAELAWLQDHGLPKPCSVTGLRVDLLNGSSVAASVTSEASFAVDLPLSHLTPDNVPPLVAVTSVPLQRSAGASRWAAYPPRLVGVRSSNGRLAFLEVEELSSRGTLGLRGLAAYTGSFLAFELGGSAEVFPGWGIDVDGLGIMEDTTGNEESNAGSDYYPFSGDLPPLLDRNLHDFVLPAPPNFSVLTYFVWVLDNHQVPRCHDGACLDVVYDQANHALRAVNDATLYDLDPGPVPAPLHGFALGRPVNAGQSAGGYGNHSRGSQLRQVRHVYERKVLADLEASLRALRSGRQLSAEVIERMLSPSRNPELPIVDLSAKALAGVAAEPSPDTQLQQTVSAHRQRIIERGLSPQEGSLGLMVPRPLHNPIAGTVLASCALNATNDALTQPLSGCNGFSNPFFRCPTPADPLRPETLPAPPGSPSAVSLYRTIPPYYASRDNYYGTCGSHQFTQYYEALLDRYADDLAPKRVVYVDGLGITVPSPRVATSVGGGLWNLYAWEGTHVGDPAVVDKVCNSDSECSGSLCCVANLPGCSRPSGLFQGRCTVTWPAAQDTNVKGMFSPILDAYWPAREGDWAAWTSSASVPALQRCAAKGFWSSGFCISQGQPPPGVYRNYQQQVVQFASGATALSNVPWSLANAYFNVVSRDISLDDRDAAIQAVIYELQKGLPVALGFWSGVSKTPANPNGPTFGLADLATWYLPPELGACSGTALEAAFQPSGGHAVNIVGYSIDGSLGSPDPFNSYFIIENNWGKSAGYRSFFFMNFAAFKFLAFSLTTYRLDARCYSEACNSRPIIVIPPIALARFEFPPDPVGPIGIQYERLMTRFLGYLAGVPASPRVPPSIPGVVTVPNLTVQGSTSGVPR